MHLIGVKQFKDLKQIIYWGIFYPRVYEDVLELNFQINGIKTTHTDTGIH
jgi:hypothetical protein